MRTHHAPETWLPKPEPSQLEKENVKLRQQLAEYKKTEPEFEVRFSTTVERPEVYQVEKLTGDEATTLVRRILDRNPEPAQEPPPMNLLNYDSTLPERYAVYAKKTVPQFVAQYPQDLELMFGQVPFKLVVSNSGNIRADNVIIEVLVVGGWFNPKPLFFTQAGPNPPQPGDSFASPLSRFNMRDLVPARVDKHEFRVDFDRRSAQFSATCRRLQTWTGLRG